MIKQSLLVISLLSTVSSFAQKGDTVSVLQNVLERQQFDKCFIKPMFHNPALHYYRYQSSLSTLSLQGKVDEMYQYAVAQEGDGWKGFKIGAESFVLLSHNARMWGKAYYENGRRENVLWNESSDFDIVYPYVAADTIGGDMKASTYFFNGGYAKAYKRWTFGGEFSYRALMEFRDKDPRPKNTIADLQGRLGAAYNLHERYAIGLTADAQKYKQNGSIQYYNELGVSKTFHLQGLGVSFVRFDGTNTTVNYQGNQWGVALTLLPTSAKGGFFASVAFHRDFKEKILPNSNDLTLNDLHESLWRADWGWTSNAERKNVFGLKGLVDVRQRDGSEFLYGDASGNVYPVIAVKENFNRKWNAYGLESFYQRNQTERWMFGGNLSMVYETREEVHKSSTNRMEWNSLNTKVNFSSTWRYKKQLLKLKIGGEFQKKKDALLDIKRTTNGYALDILKRNFNLYSADVIGYHISANWSCRVWKNKLMFVESTWAQRKFQGFDKGYHVNVNVGLSF